MTTVADIPPEIREIIGGYYRQGLKRYRFIKIKSINCPELQIDMTIMARDIPDVLLATYRHSCILYSTPHLELTQSMDTLARIIARDAGIFDHNTFDPGIILRENKKELLRYYLMGYFADVQIVEMQPMEDGVCVL